MGDNNALVSVCIPTYNGEEYIKETIESIISQTYRPIEIIISDDASIDRTLEIITKHQSESDIEIKIFNHEPNGIGANWNNCIKYASGKYVKFLFQDDLLKRDCIFEMVSFAENKDEHLGLVFSKRKIFGELDIINQKSYSQPDHPEIQNGVEILNNKNLFKQPRNKIGEPTSTLIPRTVFDKIGLFNNELEQSLDYEFWYRICHYYQVGFIKKELSEFRIHSNQTTRKNSFNVVKDRYLLPYLLLKQHYKVLHVNVVFIFLYKISTGFITYQINNLRKSFTQLFG